MRVLLISHYFPPEVGTAPHLFHELAIGLRENGHDVTVLTGFPRYNVSPAVAAEYRGLWRRESMDEIAVLRTRWPWFPREWMIGRGLEQFIAAAAMALRAAAIRRHDVTVVYSPPLTLGITAWALSKAGRGGPFVLNVQDLFPQSAIDLGAMKSPLQIAFFRWLERRLYRAAACVTVHSHGNAAHVRAAAGQAASVAVVANWADRELFRSHPKDPRLLGVDELDGEFVVSFAGTMGLSQDMEVIVQAASLLREHQDILFLLVGDGICKPEAQRLAEELDLSNIRWLPMQPREKYPQVLATSDVSMVT
ncbi:MAG: glycosyltransferase family 4 protein, partial [Armatimonadota bacterium]